MNAKTRRSTPVVINSSTCAFTFSTPESANTTGAVSDGVAARPASTSIATLFTGANVTYYTVCVIELHSRRIAVLGSTPRPDEAFVIHAMRQLTNPVDGVLRVPCVLICDRDQKWSAAVERLLATAGIQMLRAPLQAPNCNAYAERFARSIKEECLNRVIPLGDRHLQRTLAEFVAHYHRERNHQGLGNELIDRSTEQRADGRVRRRQRVGGLLSYYYRAAA